jgi:uncharacterized DUF497 family protein
MRFRFDKKKSAQLKKNLKRGVSFEDAQEVWLHPHYLDQRSEVPEQFRAIGWIKGKLYSVIFEIRDDKEGEYYHLVTLWRSTKEEEKLYEKNS